MDLICAGLQHDVDDAPGVASALGIGLGLGRKLINCIKRHDDAGDARHSALVDRRNVVPEIVVVHAVNLPVHLVGAGSVQRAEATHGITAVAGLHRGELREVTAVHRHVLDRLGGQDIVLGGAGRIESQRSRGNFHHGRARRSGGQLHRNGVCASRRDRHIIDGRRSKPGGRNFNLVRPQRQVLEGELTIAGAHGTQRDPGAAIRGLDIGSGDHSPRRIGYGTVDGAAKCLRVSEHPKQHYYDNKT